MHLDCAKKWYTQKIQLVLSQLKLPEDEVGVVHDRWMATTTATCEVCTHKVSLGFAQIVMTSIENNPSIQKLHRHIVNRAAKDIVPSISDADLEHFEELQRQFSSGQFV
jgi:hypothetical protein